MRWVALGALRSLEQDPSLRLEVIVVSSRQKFTNICRSPSRQQQMVFYLLISERSGLLCGCFCHPRTISSSKGENSLSEFVASPLCSSQAKSGVVSPESP